MRLGLIIVLYLLANAAIALLTTPGANLAQAADSSSWFEPAIALLQHGAFVDPADPTQLQTYRPPLFLAFAAGAMWFAGGPNPVAIVIGQVGILLVTGLVVRRIARDWLEGWEDAALAVTIFNPNALASAHLVQSDTLFTFFITLGLWAVLAFAGRLRAEHAVTPGIFLGLACLVRPTAQFLLVSLPVVLAIVAGLAGGIGRMWRGAGLGLIAAAVGLLVVLPWALYLSAAGQGFDLTTPAIRYRFVWDQVQTVDAQHHGVTVHESARRLEGPGGAVEQFIVSQGDAWKQLAAPEQWRRLTDFGYQTLLDYPLSTHLKTALRSAAQYLLAPGAGNWHGLFGTGTGEMSRAWFESDQSSPLHIVRLFVASAPPAALAISIICLAVLIVLRTLGLVGIAWLFIRRDWALLVVLTGLITYFTLVHVYVGNSRYRLSVEPALGMLAVAGLAALGRRCNAKMRRISNMAQQS